MTSNSFEEVVNMLLEIKHSLQKGIPTSITDILTKIDKCISKVIPFVNAYAKSQPKFDSNPIFEGQRHKSTILERSP